MSRMGSGLRKSLVLVGVLALVVPVLFACAAPVSAATLRVNNGVACDDGTGDPYCTIQAAVDDAGDGDVIQVYPGTYTEGVDLSNMGMGTEGDLTLVTVNNAGNPTPGTVTVHNTGIPAEFYTDSAFDGDLTIDGFIVHSAAPGIDVAVDGGAGANRNVVIQNVTATETEHDGIQVSADGNVTISNCIASDNAYHGINVTGVGGDVVIADCTANDNGPGPEYKYSGIHVDGVGGDVIITDTTANGNGEWGILVYIPRPAPTEAGVANGVAGGDVTITNSTANGNGEDGFWVGGSKTVSVGNATIRNCTANGNVESGFDQEYISSQLTIQDCIAQDNDDGVDLYQMSMASGVLVNGNIICENRCGVSDPVSQLNAEGNWWGCPGGPGGLACDPICQTDGIAVDFTPWISKISASSSVDSATAGQPALVSFQFSGGPPTVYLGQGPGDLRGPAPFTVTTDNGAVASSGFIGGSAGTLEVTLTPTHAGTATVWVDGPCGLDGSIVLGVVAAAEFVPEPGSVMLLGSGLLGVAGYAGLRLRKR